MIATTTLATLGLIGAKTSVVQADSMDTEIESNSTSKTSQQIVNSSEESTSSQLLSRGSLQPRAYTGQPVTVNYKNEKGEEISPKKILNGNIGNSYTAPMYVNNYLRVKQVIGNINGTFSDVPQEVTYIYTDEGESVTIVNEDENGAPVYNERGQVIPVQYITGKIGTAWTAVPMHRKGYLYKGAKTEGAIYAGAVIGYYGSLYSKPGKITFIYSDKAASITVHYLREDYSKIIADEQVTGRPDYEYDIKPKFFSGYTLKETKGDIKGAFSDKPKEVTFIYSVNPDVPALPAKISNVIVYYQDENGNQITTNEVLTGKVGDGYVTSAKVISGYTLKVRPNNATGFFTEAQQVVTYIYSANVEEPDDFKQPSTTNHQKPVVTPANKHQSRNSAVRPISKDPNRKKQLPQTGGDEQTDYSLLALGLTISLLSSFVGYIYTRRIREN